MPRGERMRRNLRKFFRGQEREVLALIERNKAGRQSGEIDSRIIDSRIIAENLERPHRPTVGKGVGRVFVAIERWLTHNASRELQEELWDNKPVVEMFVAEEGRAVIGRVGASDVVFEVTDPNVSKAIDKLVLKFGKATNATTSKALGKAIKELRAEIRAGLEAGEAITQLTKRVQTVFDSASQYRARQIAMTESNRAVHLGQQLGAEASGVVVGKQWVASTDGCPYCMALNGRQIALRESFVHTPEPGPYSETPFPPAHPNCRCDMIEIIGRPKALTPGPSPRGRGERRRGWVGLRRARAGCSPKPPHFLNWYDDAPGNSGG